MPVGACRGGGGHQQLAIAPGKVGRGGHGTQLLPAQLPHRRNCFIDAGLERTGFLHLSDIYQAGEDDFELYFRDYDALRKYCKKRFKHWARWEKKKK